MKLFTVGPVEMFPQTLQIASKQIPYFRTAEFSQLMLENERLLKKSLHASEKAKTIFLTASGTGAMEAAVMNCFDESDKVLVIDGGGFGRRFVQLCGIHHISHDVLHVSFGESLTLEKLLPFEEKRYSGLLVNLHETTTGQLYDLQLLSELCKRKQMYLVVDAISAYGADEVDFDKYGVDALIVSSQKALALAPGISMVVISERMYQERVMRIASGSLYFDFKQYIENLKRGQTPFTPAVDVLLQLHDRLRQIDRIGMKQLCDDTHKLAVRFRSRLQELGWQLPPYPLSNALTPVLVKPYAAELFRRLKEEYGLVVTPSGGELSDTLLRIGHLGNVRWADYEQLLEAMQQAKSKL